MLPLGPRSLNRFLAFYRKDLPRQVRKEQALSNVPEREQTRLAHPEHRRGKEEEKCLAT